MSDFRKAAINYGPRHEDDDIDPSSYLDSDEDALDDSLY